MWLLTLPELPPAADSGMPQPAQRGCHSLAVLLDAVAVRIGVAAVCRVLLAAREHAAAVVDDVTIARFERGDRRGGLRDLRRFGPLLGVRASVAGEDAQRRECQGYFHGLLRVE